MKIQNLPVNKRPREKLAKFGPADLKDEELLALVLRSGSWGKSALDIARMVLQKKGLGAWAQAEPGELLSHKGIGKVKESVLLACFEIGRRSSQGFLSKRRKVEQSRDVVDLVGKELEELGQEHFVVLGMDSRSRVFFKQTVYIGTLNSSLIHPREIFGCALRAGAAGIIIVHNHPSGDPTPSRNDKRATSKLRRGGKVLGVPLIDHIIVGREGYFSFAEEGW